mmetsp:Transcript_113331/g.315514  ORF Transcript_113331/g.315514 Transcript_113331/m.315514 type:complete len:85 (-) Transcript_113331:102-356(-)
MGDLKAQAALKKVEDMVVARDRNAAGDPYRRSAATMIAGLEQASTKFRVKVGVVMAKNAKLRGEPVELPHDVRAQVWHIMENTR